MSTVAHTKPMPNNYRVIPAAHHFARTLPQGELPEQPTEAQIAQSQAVQLRQRADLVEAVPSTLPHMKNPSHWEIEARESLKVHTLADEAAKLLYTKPLDELPRPVRFDLECGAAYLLRRPEAAWRAAAHQHAEPVIVELLREELGLSPQAAKYLATKCVAYAVTAYQGVLEGITKLDPGPRWRIEAARLEREGTR